MTIIYDGKNLGKLCSKLAGKEVAIYSRDARLLPEEGIYYLEKEQEDSLLKELPHGWVVEMEKFRRELLLEHPSRIFTKNFQLPPLRGELYLNGRIEAISSLCHFLIKHYRYCIGLSGEDFRLENLKVKTKGRADHYKDQPLHLHLGLGPKEMPHLHLWDGSLEEIYRLREHYEELPRFHAVIKWGMRGKSFYEQEEVQGRYLGSVSKRGYSFQWRKVITSF